MVAFVDDAGLIFTGKDLEEIRRILGDCYEEVQRWMESVGLELADHKNRSCAVYVSEESGNHHPRRGTMHHHLSAKY